MKKVALSLFVVAASAAYVWAQSGGGAPDDLIGTAPPAADILTGSIPRRAPAGINADAAPTALPATVSPSTPSEPQHRGFPNLPRPPARLQTTSAEPPRTVPSANIETPHPLAGGTTVIVKGPRSAPSIVTEARLPQPRPTYQVTPVSFTRGVETVAARGAYADGAYTGRAVDAYYGLVQVKAIVQGGRLVAIKVLQYPSDRRTSLMINRQALPMLRDEAIQAQSANIDIISGATLTSDAFLLSINSALNQAKQ